MTRHQLLHVGLLLTSLIGYLEWGGDHAEFLAIMEWQVIQKAFKGPESVIHPLVILPFLGQVFLIYRSVKPNSPEWISYLGILFIGLLILMILVVGILAMNFKIIISALPFLTFAVLYIINDRHQKSHF